MTPIMGPKAINLVVGEVKFKLDNIIIMGEVCDVGICDFR